MKRLGITLLAAALTLPIVAQEPVALWGKAVQTQKITGGSDLSLATDGGLYVIGNASTRTEEEYVTLGSDNIAPGSLYRGTNVNSSVQMIFLTKLTADGQPQWTVYSKDADAMSNSLFVQQVSDGVVVFMGLRHVEKGATHTPYFVDAANKQFSLDWALETDAATRYYIAVVMKVSNEGIIQWVRKIEADHSAGNQAIYPNALCVDDAGNIYLAGQQRAALTLKKNDQTDVVLAAHNADDWDGSASVGDLFVIKLNKEGYYQDHLQTVGSATYVTLLDMQYANEKLYTVGYITPSADNHSVSLGGKAMTLADNNFSMPFAACLHTDLTAEWAQAYTSSAKGFNMQQPTLYVNKSHLWWAGMGTTSLTTTAGKQLVIGENMNRVATLLKIDASNGDLTDGYLKPLFQTGYFGLMEDTEGSIYAAGYAGVLTGSSNPNKRTTTGCMYMDKFSAADLTAPVSTWDNMIQYVGGPTGLVCRSDGRLFTLTRSQSTANALMGGSITTGQTTESFSINICAFQLPVLPLIPVKVVKAGDANGDGAVTAVDVVEIANYIMGKPSAAFVSEAADMNGDGKVDVSDVLQLIAVMTAK